MVQIISFLLATLLFAVYGIIAIVALWQKKDSDQASESFSGAEYERAESSTLSDAQGRRANAAKFAGAPWSRTIRQPSLPIV